LVIGNLSKDAEPKEENINHESTKGRKHEKEIR